MANCSNLFHDFNQDLFINKSKKKSLINSKDYVRKKIKEYFKENHPDYTPNFFIQGSWKIGTMIRTKEDTCDLDDGIYFEREVGVTGTTLQKWVYEAVKKITGDVNHKAKCIRVNYAGDYHIDLPVYYFPENEKHPLLAVKDSDLEESDPKQFIEWYQAVKCDQLTRIIRYLKAWGDHVRNKMPSGLAFTILAQKNYVSDERDDKSLYKTLLEIRNDLEANFACIVPTTPFDDLFEDYDDIRIGILFERLDLIISDAYDAIYEEKNQRKASKKWKRYLGDRFPEGLDENIEAKEKALLDAAKKIVAGKVGTDEMGRIKPKEDTRVHNKSHRYYGDQ